MTIKNFPFQNLKKISKQEIELVRALMEFLPRTAVREQFHLAIRKMLIKHLGQEVIYFTDALNEMKFTDYCSSLPESPILIVVGLTPLKEKAIIQVDHTLAYLVIDKLLGGVGNIEEALRPLTDTEQGVLQYLIMQILSQFQVLSASASRVEFRMEKFAFHAKDVEKLVDKEEKLCVITVKVGIADQTGFIKIALPNPFIKAAFLNGGLAGYKNNPLEKNYAMSQLTKFDHITTTIWAEAGKVELTPAELKNLESGDVVLFDNSRVRLNEKKVLGNVMLRIGKGLSGGLDAQVKPDQAGFIIKNIKRGA
jgi:flagellar motor switch protein FliM